ncbi:MAG: hypothetical protein A2X64_06715 [Ignavibacteria bacterium GWF2_33_9]|nr:MAG: hypothetical protein A2X64_06715 [Ignavibacteria bacterium GWF2_33_9]
MKEVTIFTDASVHPQSKIGVGGYILLENELSYLINIPTQTDDLKNNVQLLFFENTSSTKAEIQTILSILEQISNSDFANLKINVCTDSQGITSLINRKSKLLENDYKSKTGKLFKNEELYRLFYEYEKKLNLNFVKIKGHSPSSQKDNLQVIFAVVDKFVRRKLKEIIKEI